MKKITIEDLQKIKKKSRRKTLLSESGKRAKVTVHMGTCGLASGAGEIMDTLLDEMKQKNMDDVIITTSGCAGLCSREPMVTVELKGFPPVKYVDLTPKKIKRIFHQHIVGGVIIAEYVLAAGSERVG
ncbi:(2Fe-2S) ferredoxin domain-containing protein [bacterium]|nr:(2Fe-2S) ferredoxin domain-containing protein [bacterium]RQV93722.1 MAG: (2Fe-2S) ferredoxin domain-containing protein [bacterium]